MMDVRPIRNESDYDWALAEITPYFENEPTPGTPEADRFDVLAELIGAYENRHWKIEAPDPIETIKIVMETRNHSRADFAALVGSKSRASEVLNKKRRLNLDMIHKLSTAWSIPAEMMIVPYHLVTEERSPKKRKSRTA